MLCSTTSEQLYRLPEAGPHFLIVLIKPKTPKGEEGGTPPKSARFEGAGVPRHVPHLPSLAHQRPVPGGPDARLHLALPLKSPSRSPCLDRAFFVQLGSSGTRVRRDFCSPLSWGRTRDSGSDVRGRNGGGGAVQRAALRHLGAHHGGASPAPGLPAQRFAWLTFMFFLYAI